MKQALTCGDQDTDKQRGDHRIAREQPSPDQPRDEHRQCHAQLGAHRDEHIQPEAQQYTRKHARGQRHRHTLHQLREDPREAGQHAKHGGKHERTDRVAVADRARTDHEHRRTGRGPCSDDRHPIAQ